MGYHVGSPGFGQMYPCNGDVQSTEVSNSGIPNFWAVTMGECEVQAQGGHIAARMVRAWIPVCLIRLSFQSFLFKQHQAWIWDG